MKGYTCDGQVSIFDILGQEPREPSETQKEEKPQMAAVMYECGEWVKNHGKRLMFEELEENKFYIHDYSTVSNEFFKVVYTKKKTEDTIMYVDSPRGIKAEWSWGNSFSALSRKDWVNDDESHNGWFYEMPTEKIMAAVQEKTIQQPCGRPCDVEWCSKECFLKRGRIWNTKDGGWARDSQGETLKCKERECDYEPDEFEDCFSDQEEAEAKTEEQEPQPLDIRGLCDDGYCPNCGHPFDEYMWPDEIDCEVCPECGTPLDWRVWHLKNDPKLKDKYPDLDTRYIKPDTKEIENHPFEWKYTDTEPPKIEDIYFGCIVSKDNDGEDMYTYTTIRFMDGVYWIFNHPHKEWETLEKGNKGNTVIAWREFTSSELNTIRDYDSMVIYAIEEEEEEEKPAPKKKESKRAFKKATKKKTKPEEEEAEEVAAEQNQLSRKEKGESEKCKA